MLEQAVQRNPYWGGGGWLVLVKDHTDFHNLLSGSALKWSLVEGLYNLKATEYADLTKNKRALFSFHTRTSFACRLIKGIHRMSAQMWGSKHWAILALSHYRVSSSTNSLTFADEDPPLRKQGGLGSH